MEKEQKLKEFKDNLISLSDGIVKSDFIKSFNQILKIILEVEKKLIEKINQAVNGFKEDYGALKTNTEIDLSNLKTEYQEKLDIALKEQENGLNFLRDKVMKIKDFTDGKDGRDGVDGKNGVDGEDGSSDTAEQARDKLETLTNDNRLEISAIKNLQEQLDELKNRPLGGSGGGFSKMALDLHFINDETPTDTGDATNFTLNHIPSPINSLHLYRGGARQRVGATKDFTISGKTITLLTSLVSGEELLADYSL